MSTCGQCKFGKFLAQDVTKRQCWGMPPQVVIAPAAGGKVGATFVRPIVGAGDEECALFELRAVVRPELNQQDICAGEA